MLFLYRSIAVFLALSIVPLATLAQSRSTESELIKMHKDILRFHMTGDVESWLSSESETYVVASRGEITFPTKKDREARLKPYLTRTQFKEYKDLVEPVVRISKDGTLGWLICQVKASGTQTTEDGTQEPIEFISAWIELFEKKDGKWLRVGNVSNFKPASESK